MRDAVARITAGEVEKVVMARDARASIPADADRRALLLAPPTPAGLGDRSEWMINVYPQERRAGGGGVNILHGSLAH